MYMYKTLMKKSHVHPKVMEKKTTIRILIVHMFVFKENSYQVSVV